MSIFSLPEFNHASNEEMRLADYEQRMTGKIEKFIIINTSSKTFNNQNNATSNVFNFNNQNKSGGLFSASGTTTNNIFGANTSNGLFGNNQNTGIFGNNNSNQGGGLFGNNNTSQSGGGIFGSQTSSYFFRNKINFKNVKKI